MNSRIHPDDLLFPGIAFGALMIALAFTLVMLSGGSVNLNDWYPAEGAAEEIFLGLGLGIFGAGMAWQITNSVPAFIRLRERLIQIMKFESLKIWHAVAFGIMAGIPEEMLFRGAIQPRLGVLLTALIFGALHAISGIYFVYAAVAGVLLGLVVEWRDNLWAATAAHFAYDAGVFLLLAWYVATHKETVPSDEIAYS